MATLGAKLVRGRPVTLSAFAAALVVACGGGPQSATSSPTPARTSPSPSPSPSPSGKFAANLTFTTQSASGPRGTAKTARNVQGAETTACGGGSVIAQFTLGNAEWVMQVTASSWHGPGKYSGSQQFTVTMYERSHPDTTTWHNEGQTGGTVTFDTEDSVSSLDAVLTSPVAAGTDHVTGSFSCAPL